MAMVIVDFLGDYNSEIQSQKRPSGQGSSIDPQLCQEDRAQSAGGGLEARHPGDVAHEHQQIDIDGSQVVTAQSRV